jgi:apolipoprotein N-acyltransferase
MTQLSKYKLILVSLLGGVLLGLAWPLNGIASLLFISLIPFLFIEYHIFDNKQRFSRFAVFFYTYPGFFLWNILTTWWIYYASLVGAIMAIVFNAMFMAIVFQLFHFCRSVLLKGNKTTTSISSGYFLLIVFWITFEYLHLNWELTWPWLQLGNGFANSVKLVQWYEFTGVLGGTLWIILFNVLIFSLWQMHVKKRTQKQLKKFSLLPLFTLLIPMIVSLIIYYSYKEKENPIEVVVVQPNIDPYNEKFAPEFREINWDKLLGQTKEKTTESTHFVVWPETSIPGSVFLDRTEKASSIERICELIIEHFPHVVLIAGADAYEVYDDKKTATARYFSSGECCYDSFNSAVEIDSSGIVDFYHKSKLVPGVERMPYPHIFGFLEKYAIDLGGTTGSMGTSPEPVVFSSGVAPIAPIICYESIFGEYVTAYVRKGAQLIFIITNDGWWGDTPGYRQHFAYASLRAIENRRSIARSANTGISGFINQRGDVLQAVPYWEQHVLKETINANDTLTIYSRYGDYLGRIAGFAALAIVIITIVKRFSKKRTLYQT